MIPAHTNVVVAPVPEPPETLSNYPSRSSYILGGIQLGVGVVLVVATIVVISTYGDYWGTSSLFNHFGGGAVYLIAGICGVVAGSQKTSGIITAFMVLSIISSIIAVADVFIFTIFALVANVVEELDSSDGTVKVVVAVIYILAALFVIESVVSIWSAVICCNVVCCGRRPTGGAIIHQSYVPLQTGPTMVTTVQGPLQAGVQHISFGPPPAY